MNKLVAEELNSDPTEISNYESNFNELDTGEVRFYIDRTLSSDEIVMLEKQILDKGVYLTGPIVQDAGIVFISFQKRIAPLLIIGLAAVAVIGLVVGWQIFQTGPLGIPIWAWLLGGTALVWILMSQSETGRETQRTILRVSERGATRLIGNPKRRKR